MWIDYVRLRLPPRRPDSAADERDVDRRGAARRRAWSRKSAAIHGRDEALIAAIYEGLAARGLLARSEGPIERVRRRVGYVVRDALADVRRRRPSRAD